MTLRKTAVPIAFSGGVETKQDPKGVVSTRLLDLQNATFTKATTLAKRNGYAALGGLIDSTATAYGTTRGLAVRDDELVLFTEQRAYSYRDSSDSWADAGEVLACAVDDRPIARTGTQQTQPDIATRHGITVVAWEDNRGGVWASVLEDDTGRVLVSQQQLDAGGSLPRCLQVGEVLHVLWVNGPSIKIAVVNPAMPEAALVPAVLTSDLDPTNPVYDAEPTLAAFSTDRPGLIAWAVAGGIRVGYIAAPGVLGSPLYGLPSVAFVAGQTVGAVNVCFDKTLAGNLYVGRVQADGVHLIAVAVNSLISVGFDTLVLATVLPVPRMTAEVIGATYYYAVEQTQPALRTDQQHIVFGQIEADNGTIGSTTTLVGHSLVGRAFVDASDVYVPITNGARFYPYVAVVRMSSALQGKPVAARVLAGTSSGMLLRNHLPSVVALDLAETDVFSRRHGIPLGYRIQLASANGDQFGEQGFRYVTLDLGASTYTTTQLGRGLYLASAVPLHYDGERWAEGDFHAAPDYGFDFALSGTPALAILTPVSYTGDSIVTPAAGGSMTASSTYLYRLMYEEIDANGELHPSATSVSITVVLGVGQTAVQWLVPAYRLTGKKRVRISVWRSPANQTGAPESIPFYRVTSLDPTTTGAVANGYILNDVTVDSIGWQDRMSDATLLTQEPLYTNGGILSNDPPSMAGDVLAGGQSRLFWTDPDDGDLVRYSQQLRDDTAVEMSAALSIRIDPYGGRIVGLAVMDDLKVVFRETAIHGFVGPGPDADGGLSGGAASFGPPSLITGDVGCSSSGSICQSPLGIVFQSSKGIMLLGRDRQVQRIGDPVYAYNSQTITRATLLPDRPQIVFLTDAGRTLLWDYERNQWSTYTNHEGVDAVVRLGTYHYLRNDGRVFRETVGQYADDNVHIPMRIETAWIKLAGYLQGWQRVYHAMFLGAWKSSHTLNIRYKIDYQEAWSTAFVLDVNSKYDPSLYGEGAYGVGDYGGSGGPSTVYQERIHLNKKGQSIAFRIEDVEPTGSFGASFELSEMLLTGGVSGPMFVPGAARSH